MNSNQARQRARLAIALVLFIILVVLLGVAGNSDFEAETLELKSYCRMVDIYDKSNGAYGHPDYKNIKDLCGADNE